MIDIDPNISLPLGHHVAAKQGRKGNDFGILLLGALAQASSNRFEMGSAGSGSLVIAWSLQATKGQSE